MAVTLKVCVGSSCHLQGAEKVVQNFQEIINTQNLDAVLELKGSFCLGDCSNDGVAVSVNEKTEIIKSDDAETYFVKTVIPLLNK